MPPEEHAERQERHARFRRLKQLLRFVPRRAVMHKYPIVGRFAEMARKRAYLWSFKTPHMRPAFYAGAILSLMPVLGVQIPLALLLALLLRANFMVMAALQFITTPFTAAPVYYATHQLGRTVIEVSGFGRSVDVVNHDEPLPPAGPLPPPRLEAAKVKPEPANGPVPIGRRIGTAINALVIGGVIAGALIGLLLDLLWRFALERSGGKLFRRPWHYRSTEPTGPPK